MTNQQFLDKWHDLNIQGWWAETPSRMFWARSYQLPRWILFEMSEDLLSIPGLSSDSSTQLALRTVGEPL